MRPVLTPEEMRAVDAAAPEPVEVLIERAGAAVARAAVDLLGGTYGRRVVVVAGKGNNGADGRAAARRLAARGVRVEVLDAAAVPPRLPRADLVVDAAYGTGFRGGWAPPDPAGAPVLAVDIPSGVDGLTGEVGGGALAAARTVTFAALKPGLLLGAGPALAGDVEVADIGLDVSGATAHLVEAADVAAWLPDRARDSHKWKAAVWLLAGSPGMTGAAHLAARAAQRAGAGYVRVGSPGVDDDPVRPTEAVGRALPAEGFAPAVLDDLDRFGALAAGPGLGRAPATDAGVREVLAAAPVPVVVDGDGLTALAGGDGPEAVLRARPAPTVLTPHDGEFARLAGAPPPPDRVDAARRLAARRGATVLLKGPTTVVADPDGAALLAQGVPPARAAAAGAWLHGRAGALGFRRGLVAGDLADLLPVVLDDPTREA